MTRVRVAVCLEHTAIRPLPSGIVAIGAYPGSFNPPTLAHMAIAHAAVAQAHLERLDLVVSRQPLGKGVVEVPSLEDRLDVLRGLTATRAWLRVRITDARLLVDIAQGYDVLVVGADKLAQLHDVAWYADEDARDQALARLPRLLVAARPPHPTPPSAEMLDLDPQHHAISSSAVRAGAWAWMAPEAAAFDERTGAWSDAVRYRAWIAGGRPIEPDLGG